MYGGGGGGVMLLLASKRWASHTPSEKAAHVGRRKGSNCQRRYLSMELNLTGETCEERRQEQVARAR